MKDKKRTLTVQVLLSINCVADYNNRKLRHYHTRKHVFFQDGEGYGI